MISDKDFIIINITQDILEKATRRANEIPVLKNSIRNGDGRLIGCLGEECCHFYFKTSKESIMADRSLYNFDLIYNNKKIEVKSKQCYSVPRIDYDGTVYKYNLNQKTDYYLFTRILLNKVTKVPLKCYLIGYISKKD